MGGVRNLAVVEWGVGTKSDTSKFSAGRVSPTVVRWGRGRLDNPRLLNPPPHPNKAS
jgi:hypothetical protein